MLNLLRVGALALALLSCSPTAALAQDDPFGGFSDSVSSPCRRWTTITPSDTVDLATVPKAIYVGGGGDIVMIGINAPSGASGVAWKNVPDAALLPVRPRRVLATGTTATFLVACF